ncbi:hypothetical protein P154DRAFT_380384, partial [Amniculicola lignicola CBS 123094]
ITLDVGGRLIRALRTTLDRSPRLAKLVERFAVNMQCDGTIFVDADIEVFSHVLSFLRRPDTFPLFWSKATGFDYGLYARVKEEARYFGVKGLVDWIEERGYEKAVKQNVKYEKPVEIK